MANAFPDNPRRAHGSSGISKPAAAVGVVAVAGAVLGGAALLNRKSAAPPPGPVKPGAPTDLVASNITQTSFVLTVLAPAVGTPPLEYDWFNGGVQFTTTDGPSVSVDGLEAGTAYPVSCQCSNEVGTGPKTVVVNISTLPATVITPPPGVPLTPTGLHAEDITATAFTLVCEPSDTATAYIFNIGGNLRKPQASPTIKVGPITAGQHRVCMVAASNAHGTSAFSAPITVQTT